MKSANASAYTPAPQRRFNVGDRVLVTRSYPPGHRRTPSYIRGKQGVIERVCGVFPNPEELAYGFSGEPKRVLYRVRFEQQQVWPDYQGPAHDFLEMEIYEHWLEPCFLENGKMGSVPDFVSAPSKG
jgi:nitrile hydratase